MDGVSAPERLNGPSSSHDDLIPAALCLMLLKAHERRCVCICVYARNSNDNVCTISKKEKERKIQIDKTKESEDRWIDPEAEGNVCVYGEVY